MRKVLLLCYCLLWSWGCSHGLRPQELVIERNWARSTLSEIHYGSRLVHRMSPMVTDDLIIQGNSIDGIVAYDRQSMAERWRINLQGGVEAGIDHMGSYLFFAANDGHFYSVQKETGEILWSYPIRSEGVGEPTFHDGLVYFISGNDILHALNAESGQQEWLYNRRSTSSLSIRGASKPRVQGDQVYAGFSDGSLVALDRRRGSVQWEVSLVVSNRRFQDVDSQPIIDNNRIYVSSYDGALFCLDQSNGQPIWRVDRGGYSAVTLTQDRVFYATSDGHLLALDRSSGQEIWSQPLKSQVGTRPLLHRGLVIVGEYTGSLRVFDTQTGEDMGSFDPGRGVTSTPTLIQENDELLFISADANLFSVRVGRAASSILPRWWQ